MSAGMIRLVSVGMAMSSLVMPAAFFWVDQAPGQWETVSGSTGVGGVAVTVQAEPVRLVVDPGDGGSPLICDGVPTVVTRETYHPSIEGCSVVYRNSSAMAPNGETFPVTATIVWHATRTASTGEGGDLGYVSTTSAVRDLRVAEQQQRDPRTPANDQTGASVAVSAASWRGTVMPSSDA